MKQASTRQLYQYWNELRGLRTAPERENIDPADIGNILPDTFILEADCNLDFPFRVVGARTNALFDRQLKGEAFISLWRPEDQRTVRAMLLTTLDGACPIIAGAMAAPADRAAVELELLLLPLRLNGKTHARLLGCLAPARHPDWFGLLSADRIALTSMRVLRSEREQRGDLPRQPERSTFAKQSQVSARQRFTVYEGGRSRGSN